MVCASEEYHRELLQVVMLYLMPKSRIIGKFVNPDETDRCSTSDVAFVSSLASHRFHSVQSCKKSPDSIATAKPAFHSDLSGVDSHQVLYLIPPKRANAVTAAHEGNYKPSV